MVDAQGVDQVLHAGVGPNIAVSVVTLGSQDGFQALHDLFLGDESHVIGGTRKGGFLVVGASHAATDHNVEPLEFALVISDDHASNVVGVNVQGVVSGNGDTDFEFAGEVSVSVERFRGMVKDDSPSTVVGHGLVDVEFLDLFSPDFGGGHFFSVQPQFGKGGGHGSEEVRKDLGIFAGVCVVGGNERGGCRHDVAVDVSAGADGGGSDVHDGGNDGLERSLHDSVYLEALARGGSEISLPVVCRKIVDQAV
mmetsp:Transcript_1011/g.2336  ORF Transcript_1011/g.2336 Transcript_1011/m.2336 type:complete len:252 (-) Transcript_1011:745-1500(-)